MRHPQRVVTRHTMVHRRDQWLFGLAAEDVDEGVDEGTVLLARSAGFLCVISLLSTLRRPLVISEPLFRSANTAPMPPAGAAEDAGGGGGAAGAAGGGGGEGG